MRRRSRRSLGGVEGRYCLSPFLFSSSGSGWAVYLFPQATFVKYIVNILLANLSEPLHSIIAVIIAVLLRQALPRFGTVLFRHELGECLIKLDRGHEFLSGVSARYQGE